MKVAITGYRGFIGSALLKECAARGIDAVGVEPTASGEYDRVYHLACPATTARIVGDTTGVMDAILDATRQALNICPTALFINASSQGAAYPNDPAPQGGYNVAKLCMEVYLKHCAHKYNIMSYRLPAVYGSGMDKDFFVRRCVDGTAYRPTEDRTYQIAHIDDVVDSLITLAPVNSTRTTLSEVYQKFTSGEWTLDMRKT